MIVCLKRQQSFPLIPSHPAWLAITKTIKDSFFGTSALLFGLLQFSSINDDLPPENTSGVDKLPWHHYYYYSSLPETQSCLMHSWVAAVFGQLHGSVSVDVLNIVSLSQQYGIFPYCLQMAIVRHFPRKISLDSWVLSNYRPISCIQFLSKIMEKRVSFQLNDYLGCFLLV